MDEYIDELWDAQVFSALDANSGYWQIEVHKEDRKKTADTSHRGLHKLKKRRFAWKARQLRSNTWWTEYSQRSSDSTPLYTWMIYLSYPLSQRTISIVLDR